MTGSWISCGSAGSRMPTFEEGLNFSIGIDDDGLALVELLEQERPPPRGGRNRAEQRFHGPAVEERKGRGAGEVREGRREVEVSDDHWVRTTPGTTPGPRMTSGTWRSVSYGVYLPGSRRCSPMW